ncbi:MAG TPA: N-acetyltransferase [Acholeplasmataceae bacterium]|nr:N-acetyltransferase [Acholeplasmataceae bacterium]
MNIKQGNNKFYIGNSEEEYVAEVTYKLEGDVMVVDHTFVNEELRDQNIARKLLDHLLEYAKTNSKKIKPVCPYVVKMFERNPDWSYLLANQN